MIAVAALVSWAVTAGLGGWMLSRWLLRGGLARLRAGRDRLGPLVITGHFSLALTGLACWAVFVAGRWPAAAWTAISLLMLAVGLGISTVTLWTPYPARGAAGIRGPEPAAGPAGGLAAGAAGGPAATPGEPDRATAPGPGPGEPGEPGEPGGMRRPGAAGDVPAGDVPLAEPVTDAMLAKALTDQALLSRLVADVVARAGEMPGGGAGAGRRPAGSPGPARWAGQSRAAGRATASRGPGAPGPRGSSGSRARLRGRSRVRRLAALIPVVHGIGALVTVVLAVTAAAGAS